MKCHEQEFFLNSLNFLKLAEMPPEPRHLWLFRQNLELEENIFQFLVSPVDASSTIFFSRRGKASSVRNWLHLAQWPSLSDGWPTWPTPSERSASGCLPTHRYHQWQVITLCLILLQIVPGIQTFSIQLFSISPPPSPLLPDLPVASLNCPHKVLAVHKQH